MALADASHFDRLVDFLKQKRDNVTFHDIIALAEISAQSLQSFFHALDAKVYGELREIARYIESMRHEIGALQVNDLKNSRIPAAGEELGALEGEVNTNRQLFETFLTRFREIVEQQDLQESDAKILSAASPPNVPSHPRIKLLTLIAFAASLVVGGLLVFITGILIGNS